MMENNYVFIKKYKIKAQRKKRRIPIYLTKIVLKERQMQYLKTKKVDLDES